LLGSVLLATGLETAAAAWEVIDQAEQRRASGPALDALRQDRQPPSPGPEACGIGAPCRHHHRGRSWRTRSTSHGSSRVWTTWN